jgi:hypothetical protein
LNGLLDFFPEQGGKEEQSDIKGKYEPAHEQFQGSVSSIRWCTIRSPDSLFLQCLDIGDNRLDLRFRQLVLVGGH